MMSETENDVIDDSLDFGKILSVAREAQGYSINDVFENIKIPEEVLTAIEASDLESLPASTFTKGHIRSYAKFLEISEEEVLKAYNQALPDKSVSGLKPSNDTPEKEKLQLPLSNNVTILLVVIVIIAFFYGGFQYIQGKTDDVENSPESNPAEPVDRSGEATESQKIIIEQNARLTDDGELIVGDSSEEIAIEPESEGDEFDSETVLDVEQEADDDTVAESADIVLPEDTIEFYTQDGSWLEVRDANDERLFYNMLPEDGRKTLTGHAPFSVFMGNATTSMVKINGIEVDYSVRIRANKTVRFNISSKDQEVIFHK